MDPNVSGKKKSLPPREQLSHLRNGKPDDNALIKALQTNNSKKHTIFNISIGFVCVEFVQWNYHLAKKKVSKNTANMFLIKTVCIVRYCQSKNRMGKFLPTFLTTRLSPQLSATQCLHSSNEYMSKEIKYINSVSHISTS